MANFKNYEVGDQVLVRVTGNSREQKGRVTELAGQGVYVKKDDGHSNFYYWNRVRPDPEFSASRTLRPRTDSARATIADIVPPSLVSRINAAQQAPKPTPPVSIQTPPPPTPPAVVSSPPVLSVVKPLDKIVGPNQEGFEPPDFNKNFGVPRRSMSPRARSTPRRPTKVGQVIKDLRIQRSWTQDKMAKECDFNRARIVDLESGDGIPNHEEIVQLSKVLETNLIEVWQESCEKRKKENRRIRRRRTNRDKKQDESSKARAESEVTVLPPGAVPPPLPPSAAVPPVAKGKIRLKIGDVEVEADTPQEAAALIKALKDDG